VLLAFADAARDHGWARPSVLDGPPRTHTAARRGAPADLAQLFKKRYVANDVRLVGGDEVGRAPHMMLVTGPN
jgi:DNA mismatch repair ATPase MutS